MSRLIGADLKAHFGSETTTLAILWELTLVNGTVMGFTNHDVDIVYGGTTYVASTGFIPSDIAIKSDMSVTNQEIKSILDSEHVKFDDVHRGLYDYAEVNVMMVNYKDLSQGHVTIMFGWLGQVTTDNGEFVAEIRGITQKLDKGIGSLYSNSCRAEFCDSKCKLDSATYTSTGTVSAVASDNQSFSSSTLTQANGFFKYGKVTWTSGDNTGLEMEIRDFLDGTVSLVLPMSYTIVAGDGFSIVRGCDKMFATCKNTFNNALNFRGEPHLPGRDAIFKTAGTFK